MTGDKFWDRNTGKFRLLITVMSVLFATVIIYNMITFASAIFSGTVYMQLPSKLYINKDISLKKIDNTVSTIPAGSFLISINGKSASTQEEYDNIINNLKKDDPVLLKILNFNKSNLFSETKGSAYFDAYSDTLYVYKSGIPENYIRYLSNGGSFIGYVIYDGATYQAGLKAGDVLLSIKDRDVKMLPIPEADGFDKDFYRFFRNLSKEEPIPYRILRSGETMTVNVWLATFGISTLSFFVVICGMSFLVVGLFYGIKKPNFIPSRLIAVAFTLIGFEIAASLNLGFADFDVYNFIKIYVTNVIVIFFQPLIFHSLLYFPDVKTKLLENKWHLRITYLIAFITFAVFSFLYFTDINRLDGGLIMFMVIANMIYYTVVRFIYAKGVTDKNRVSRKISFIWIAVYLSVFFIPVLGFFKVKIHSPLAEYNFFFLFLIPAAYLYFTWRYRLLDIDFHLRRNIQYVFITVLWKTILLGLFVFVLWKTSFLNLSFPNIKFSTSSIEILSAPLDVSTNLFYNKLVFILVAFLSGVLIYKSGKWGQDFFDRKFYRQKFDYKYAQEELVRLFQKKFTLESLARVIVEKVSTLVRVKTAGVVFSGESKKVWDGRIFCYNNKEEKQSIINMEHKYFESIRGFKGTFTVNYLPAESKEFLESKGFLNVIPIKVNERLLGALFIGEKLSETPLKGDDFEFLSAIVTSTSIAVENAFLYEELTKRERMKRELEIAHNIQVASLPQNVPVVPGLDIFATSIPALEVGGDFYDFLNGTANGLTIVMGDVSGKGTSAALYMSKVQGIFQTLHEFDLSPVKLMTRANHLLYKHIDSKSYITAIGANFDTLNKTLSFARAGHLPLYYYNHNIKEIRKIQPNGMGLGLSEKNIFDYSIEEIKIEYSTGDIFLFVSDGVLEALNRAGEQYGEAKLLELVKINSESDTKKIVNDILDSVKSFTSDTSQYDDITVVAVKSI